MFNGFPGLLDCRSPVPALVGGSLLQMAQRLQQMGLRLLHVRLLSLGGRPPNQRR